MPNYNSMTVIGHLGRDPEQRDLPSGKRITSFNVAYTDKYEKDDNKKTMWFRCTIFAEKLGEVAMQYLHKGDAVQIVGRLKLNEFLGKDGVMKSSLELNVQDLVMLGGAKTHDEAPAKDVNDDLDGDLIPY